MAIYRFEMKHGSRGRGEHATAHARYILRFPPYDYNTHQLKYHESGNIPLWAKDELDFWEKVDKHEFIHARLYSEWVVALPRELTVNQQVETLQHFVSREIGTKYTYTFVLHHGVSHDKKGNPHAHIMFSPRLYDGIPRSEELFFRAHKHAAPETSGAHKDRSLIHKSRLKELRISWQDVANESLARAGIEVRIDHRSLKDRGIDRIPEPKLTNFETMLWRQGIASEKVQTIKLIRKVRLLETKLTRSSALITKLSEQRFEALLEEFTQAQNEYERMIKQLFADVDGSTIARNERQKYQDILTHEGQDQTVKHCLEDALKKERYHLENLSSHFAESQKLHRLSSDLLTEIRAYPPELRQQLQKPQQEQQQIILPQTLYRARARSLDKQTEWE